MVFELKSVLLPHQTIGVDFLIERELEEKGSLSLDDCGLGKTVQALSLLITKQNEEIDEDKIRNLIIVPSNLIDNWINEIKTHTTIPMDSIFIYTGPNRREKKNFNDIFIVITSYNILAREFSLKLTNCLFQRKFQRIICDEAHKLKNMLSQSFRAAELLSYNYIHLLTATPISNEYNEVYPYIKLTKQIDNYTDFYCIYGRSHRGLNQLKELISKISMKRVREETISLPLKLELNIYLEFSDEHNEFYNTLFDYSANRLQKFIELTKLFKDNKEKDILHRALSKLYTKNVLVFILRLRQCCCSPFEIMAKMKRLTSSSLKKAIIELKEIIIPTKDECPICMDNLIELQSNCGHACCKDCWDYLENSRVRNCPFCRQELKFREFLQIRSTDENLKKRKEIELESRNPTNIPIKMKYCLKKIQEIQKDKEKIVIGSNWKFVLYSFKYNLNLLGIKFIEISGDIPISLRQNSINLFNQNPDYTVCLISTSCSAEGINLTSANHVLIYEPYWNDTQNKQLQDRTHRIGQTKEVFVEKIYIKESVETALEDMINQKKELVKNLLSNKLYTKDCNLDFLQQISLMYKKRKKIEESEIQQNA